MQPLGAISVQSFAAARAGKQQADETFDRYRDEVSLGGTVPCLSEAEMRQLGQPSNSREIPTPGEWKNVRRFLVEKSLKRNPELDPTMTAYTPGETLDLMEKPAVREWHQKMRDFKLPDDADLVVFVPCAATKPWEGATRGIYKSYNQLRDEMGKGEFPRAYFVTVSEPLGLVPEEHWSDFPSYDNPGLFRNDSARAGRTTTREWLETFGKNYVIPFDDQAYDQAIDGLAGVIADFAANNQKEGRVFLSFVDDPNGLSTHTDMLQRAGFMPPENMYPKRSKPREAPYQLLRETIQERS